VRARLAKVVLGGAITVFVNAGIGVCNVEIPRTGITLRRVHWRGVRWSTTQAETLNESP
jgi:hypothetical protein